MRVIDCSGDPQQIGECTGEALRLEIAEHIELFPMQRWQEFDARLPDFLEALQRHLPQVLEEIRATARGAGVEEREILRLNLPLFAAGLDPDTSGCTNFVFSGGRDGPLWGKNNDGCEPHRPVVARYVRSTEGIPQVTFTFAGLLAITDGMNADGASGLHADRRPPAGKLDAHQRWHFLDRALGAGDGPPPDVDVSAGCGGADAVPQPGAAGTDLEFARTLLHHHGDVVSLCRHGEPLGYHSEYSMIGMSASCRLLFCDIHPCEQEYQGLVVQ